MFHFDEKFQKNGKSPLGNVKVASQAVKSC
jgi:hypothetical protein